MPNTNIRFTTAPKLGILSWRLIVGSLVAALMLAGCASTKVTNQDAYKGPDLPRPDRIIVYDLAATPSDIPSWSQARKSFAGAGAKMTAEEVDAGRKLGADVAKTLVEKINSTGMKAVRAHGQPSPAINDIVLIGYFTSVEEGSGAKRALIGFGQGAASVGAHVEGYHMTKEGLVLLGSGDADSEGGKSPGLVVPALVTIATANPIGLLVTGAVKVGGEVSGKSGAKGSADRIADEVAEVLEKRFKEQGWI
jgi:hypothetical protein